MSLEEDIIVLIDYEKYQERTRRVQRQINGEWARTTNASGLPRLPSLFPYQTNASQNHEQIRTEKHGDHHYECNDKESAGISQFEFSLL